jgi:primosomal protein N' (replication factor Y)
MPGLATIHPAQPRDFPSHFKPGDLVSVLLPLPLAGAYDYVVGEGGDLTPGDFVHVPLGKRLAIGVVWGQSEGGVAVEKRRATLDRIAAPPLPGESRRLVDWVANYTLAPKGAVLKMTMSVPDALRPAPVVFDYVAAPQAGNGKITAARQRVIEAAWAPLPISELARMAGVGIGVVKALVASGGLAPRVRARAGIPIPDLNRPGPVLSPDQAAAAQVVKSAAHGGFSVTVLDGVTGSGKTEVYLDMVAEVLAKGRQALLLLPEIALSAQVLKRVADRFGVAPAEWHSDLTPARRRTVWRAVAEGEARIVVGARSALFLPFPDLGGLVVDEEHDSSFKQDDGVAYHGRDMAVVRARIGDIPIVLCSATPSLETQTNVKAGRYRELHLPSRHGGAQMPEIELVDLRRTPPSRNAWISPPLVNAVSETLAAGEQALLFLNRRGYAPLTLCRTCGHRLQCPNCAAWLVEHRKSGRLVCHHCGHSRPLPIECPSCAAKDSFAACGPGVERLAEEAAARFPDARIEVMASDTLTGPGAAAAFLARMESHEIDLLIGTQVVAKGHHFPMLTVVGIVDADLGLAGGDLRAAERTFQLLSQVGGRAGRADRPGRVMVQTVQPDHPVMIALASGDGAAFYEEETRQRREAGMPPFGRLAALIVSGADPGRVDAGARALARQAPSGEGIWMYGPAPAPLALLRGRHRRRLLLKTVREIDIHRLLRRWIGEANVPSGVRVQIDVDPYSFM